MSAAPTPDADLNAVVGALVDGARTVLGANFRAAYLQGSFAVGDWDAHSDVDFLLTALCGEVSCPAGVPPTADHPTPPVTLLATPGGRR
ncbi:MAG TPA: nucleotidyltransferase domain-containing protein [Ktedonobacterales bacterium]|jgi:hypothetical protein